MAGGLDARSKQFKSRPAIHLTLDGLEFVDMSFYMTIAPGHFDGSLHRTPVLLQRADEPLHSVYAGIGGSLHPIMQRLDLAGPQDGTKAHHQAAHDRISGTDLFQGIHDLLLLNCHLWL